MLLRIEDTDVERNRPELVDGILAGLKWLGIEWDEAPYFQSQRLGMYRNAAERLLASGAGFACYCKPAAYGGADAAGEEEGADSEHRALVQTIDKAVKRGALHRNTGARKKSRAAQIRHGVPEG